MADEQILELPGVVTVDAAGNKKLTIKQEDMPGTWVYHEDAVWSGSADALVAFQPTSDQQRVVAVIKVWFGPVHYLAEIKPVDEEASHIDGWW